MLRKTLLAVLAALLVLPGVGRALGTPEPARIVTLVGRLEYVTSLSAPHYTVHDYVLLYPDLTKLENLAGQTVTVVGTESYAPSIYMRKTLNVTDILRSDDAAPPEKDDDRVTIPVMPGPTEPEPEPVKPAPTMPGPEPAPAKPVPEVPAPNPLTPEPVTPTPMPVMPAPAPELPSLPAKPEPTDPAPPVVTVPEPLPLHGTPYAILFGRVEYTGKEYMVVQERIGGNARIPVKSVTVDLDEWVGQHVGLVVVHENTSGARCHYQVVDVVPLSGDLGHVIRDNNDLVFSEPPTGIAVKLHGEAVEMDQPPILGNGRTLVPLRAIAEALGADVTWDGSTRTARVMLGTREVSVRIGMSEVIVRQDGEVERVVEADITPVIVNGRTLVPVRVVAESLGLTVGWQADSWTVTLD